MKTRFTPHINLQTLKSGLAYLTMQISCSDKRVKYNLGLPAIDAHPKTGHWNFKTKKLRPSATVESRKRVDEVLARVNAFVEGKAEVSADSLINHLRILDGKEGLVIAPTEDQSGVFFKEVKNIIRDASRGTLLNPTNDQKYDDGTIICWTKTLNKLKDYLPGLTFDVTMDDYEAFKLKCQDAGLSNSYIGCLIKDWKTFMKHAEKRGLHTNPVYRSEAFKQITEDPTTQVALSLEDLEALKKVELKGMQDEIRDMFLFNCENGLRISDIERFNKTAIIQDGFATLVTEKTGEEVVVELKDEYYRIVAKYGKLPDPYHRNVINREIKDIAKKAGITSKVKVISVRGGKTIVEDKSKHSLIKNHTARRTFATLLAKTGEDIASVADAMAITVATASKSYDKRTKLEKAMERRKRRLQREAATV